MGSEEFFDADDAQSAAESGDPQSLLHNTVNPSRVMTMHNVRILLSSMLDSNQ